MKVKYFKFFQKASKALSLLYIITFVNERKTYQHITSLTQQAIGGAFYEVKSGTYQS